MTHVTASDRDGREPVSDTDAEHALELGRVRAIKDYRVALLTALAAEAARREP
jgi:hypothetical protein